MDEFARTTRSSSSVMSTLQGGATIRDAKLAYKTFGELNADKGNAIVYPTWYSGRHWDNEWLIGEGMALDPAKYFIIVPNMLGNGLSSSPSNTPPPYDQRALPERHVLGPGRAAAQARHREVRDRDPPARDRLVDGRRPDLPVGGQLPRHGAARVPVLRLVEDQRAQHRVPRGRQGGADRRRGVQGGLVRRDRRPRACAPPPASMPAGASRRPSTGTRSTRGWATPRSRTSSSGSGRASSSTVATPTTCSRCSGPGRTATSATRPGFDGDHIKALQSIKARRSCCRPRRTCTSRRRTRSGRRSTCPTGSCG